MKVENVLSPPAYNTCEGTSDLTTLPLYASEYPGSAISCSPYRHGGGSPPPPPYPGCSEGGAGTPLDDIHMEDDEGRFFFSPPPSSIPDRISLLFLHRSTLPCLSPPITLYFLLYSPSRPSLYSQPLLLHPNFPFSPPPPPPSSPPHPTSFLFSPSFFLSSNPSLTPSSHLLSLLPPLFLFFLRSQFAVEKLRRVSSVFSHLV
jgi:hypothetical protein